MAVQTNATNIGSYHLASNPKMYEIARSNNFEFVVTDIDNIPTVYEGTLIPNAQEVLRFSVVQASLPHFTQEVITIRRGNSVIKYAGVPSYDAGSLVVNDYIGADTKSVLMAWQGLSYNVNTEKVGSVTDYKKDCYLIEYTPDYKQIRQWLLYGCWISGISEPEYNQESGDKRTITATIQYDKAMMILPDAEE